MSNALLTALAILTTNWDGRSSGYTDNFLPFVRDCLRRLGPAPAPVSDIHECVKDTYGIDLPTNALATILRRASKRGFVQRNDHRYALAGEPGQNTDLTRARTEAAREIGALTQRFREHCASRNGVDLSPQEAEAALEQYIETWGAPILRCAIEGRPLDSAMVDGAGPSFLVGDFILGLMEHDPPGAQYLETLVKGSMLRTALYLPDIGRTQASFRGTTIFFDTPFLLGALGVNGLERKAATRELLALAKNEKAHLGCFEETVSEMRGVLAYEAAALLPPGPGQARMTPHPQTLEAGWSSADIDHLANRLEDALADLGVAVEERPDWSARDSAVESRLRAALGSAVRYAREPALEHDLNCLMAIYRLRGRKVRLHFEASRALFVTTNAAVAEAARRTLPGKDDPLAAPPAVLDHEFATILWLKQPTRAPELPWKQVVADCHAALNPSDAVWSMYLDKIEALLQRGEVTDDEYYVARTVPEARRMLARETRGRADRMNEQLAREAAEAAQEAVREPVRRAEMENRRAAAEQAARERAAREAEHADQLAAHQVAAVVGYRTRTARSWANGIASALVGVLSAAIGVLLLLGALGDYVPGAEALPAAIRVAMGVGAGLVALFAALTYMGKGRIGDWTPGFKRRVSRRLEKAFLRLLPPAHDEEPEGSPGQENVPH